MITFQHIVIQMVWNDIKLLHLSLTLYSDFRKWRPLWDSRPITGHFRETILLPFNFPCNRFISSQIFGVNCEPWKRVRENEIKSRPEQKQGGEEAVESHPKDRVHWAFCFLGRDVLVVHCGVKKKRCTLLLSLWQQFLDSSCCMIDTALLLLLFIFHCLLLSVF